MAAANDNTVYKIVLVGSAGVGKTNLLNVGLDGSGAYSDKRPTTLTPEFGEIHVPHPDREGEFLRAQIWDTAGQERYQAVTASHYRRAHGALVVFDVSNRASFTALDQWHSKLTEAAGDTLKAVMCVENKIDLLPEGPKSTPRDANFVQADEVRDWVKARKTMYSRTSAAANDNVSTWGGKTVTQAISALILKIHAAGAVKARRATMITQESFLDSPSDNKGGAAAGGCAC